MVEGDGCHRVAAQHRKSLVGRKMMAQSPNQRFKAGAQAIIKAGGVLLKIEVHGKNMFYFFGTKGREPSVVVRVHFGMAGAFAVYKGEEPDTTANTRLRLETVDSGPKLVAHLSAMTVQHGVPSKLYASLAARLGSDPLREDADPEGIVARCSVAKKPIGGVLMDQSMFAGVGNIYRTETLYEAGIHPNQPANTLTRKELLKLWSVIVKQMQAGFRTGSIWGKKSGAFCYNRTKSACGGKVKSWTMGGRTVYACLKRQCLDSRRPAVNAIKVQAGTAHLGTIVSAVSAESKKRRLGEGLAVQHVALKDDETRAAAIAAKKRPATSQVSSAKRRKR